MTTEPARAEVEALVRLLDHSMEEHGFGFDEWHSLIRNLAAVEAGDWDAVPPGGERTIHEMVVHVGNGYLQYDNHAFGDGTREWKDRTIEGRGPGSSKEEAIAWLRAAHGQFRDSVARLTDEDLGQLRPFPWGERVETRRIVEITLQHAIYHAGEINHIRALHQGNDAWGNDDLGKGA
jgi:hypothetical protein